jgi:hypothetical protein
MKLLIDPKGRVGFDEWFKAEDVPIIMKAFEGKIKIEQEETEYPFHNEPCLFKPMQYAEIPMTPKNISIMLLNPDLNDDVIMKMMGIERDSSYVITTRIRKLQGEYVKWQKIDKTKNWKNEEERILAFAGYYQKKTTKRIDVGDKVITKDTKKEGKVIAYDDETKMYSIETEDGFQSPYKKNGFTLKVED